MKRWLALILVLSLVLTFPGVGMAAEPAEADIPPSGAVWEPAEAEAAGYESVSYENTLDSSEDRGLQPDAELEEALPEETAGQELLQENPA